MFCGPTSGEKSRSISSIRLGTALLFHRLTVTTLRAWKPMIGYQNPHRIRSDRGTCRTQKANNRHAFRVPDSDAKIIAACYQTFESIIMQTTRTSLFPRGFRSSSMIIHFGERESFMSNVNRLPYLQPMIVNGQCIYELGLSHIRRAAAKLHRPYRFGRDSCCACA